MSDETTELQSLSKLKKAGKLRYWRGTIEIPETELHAICDEIQAEHDHAIATTLEEKPRDRTEEWLRKACNQAMQDYVTQLERERDEWKTKCESRDFAYFAYKQADAERKRYSEQIDKLRAERDEWKAKLADLSARAERTCHIIEYDEAPYSVCSECDAVQLDDYTVYFCWNCGRMTGNELKRLVTDSELKRLVEVIMQADLQVNGPVSDDPKEAYVRGIERGVKATLLIIGGSKWVATE